MTISRILQRFLLVGFFPGILWMLCNQTHAQGSDYKSIDTRPFADAAHHWYDIFEKGNVIVPKPNQPKYKPDEIAAIADNILLYQKDNGGWPKNYDIQAILTDAQKDSLRKVKHILNTTFDNSTTWSHVECLAKVYTATKNEAYKVACLKGLDFILSAQYANGGWPQYFPLMKDYSKYITYNDDVFTGIMGVLKNINDAKPWFSFIENDRRSKLKAAFEKGLDCIINTQITDNASPTAWCQQHDDKTLQPAWARAFEPPSICNGESADVVLLLMNIKNPDKKIINAVQNAVAWFNESKIMNTRVKTIQAPVDTTKYTISKTDKVVVTDPTAPPIWTRYYELKTHRPMFCNRDRKIVYSLAEVERERRDGYGWHTYAPQKVLDLYKNWHQLNAPGKNVLEN
ncbi:MAG: pectate lyase [Bacteroidota bacterium]